MAALLLINKKQLTLEKDKIKNLAKEDMLKNIYLVICTI